METDWHKRERKVGTEQQAKSTQAYILQICKIIIRFSVDYDSSLQNALICLWTLRCCIPYFREHVSTRKPGSLINHKTFSLSCFFSFPSYTPVNSYLYPNTSEYLPHQTKQTFPLDPTFPSR